MFIKCDEALGNVHEWFEQSETRKIQRHKTLMHVDVITDTSQIRKWFERIFCHVPGTIKHFLISFRGHKSFYNPLDAFLLLLFIHESFNLLPTAHT